MDVQLVVPQNLNPVLVEPESETLDLAEGVFRHFYFALAGDIWRSGQLGDEIACVRVDDVVNQQRDVPGSFWDRLLVHFTDILDHVDQAPAVGRRVEVIVEPGGRLER